MMTPNKIAASNPSQTADYYLHNESYYSPESQPAYSEWWGNGAEMLGLTGTVSEKDLVALFEGKLPNGVTIPSGANGERRPGYDITCSAPKSVSQAMLVGGDWRLFEAHKQAVGVMLAEIERDCAEARITVDGATECVKTGNVTVARVPHFTSRALDPQFHEHGLFLNMTLADDGKWRALASQSAVDKANPQGFSEKLYAKQLYYGAIYHAELAVRCSGLGWTPVATGKNGMFELAEIPAQARAVQSKRRNEIEAQLAKYPSYTQKMADIVTLNTRESKTQVEPESLEAFWRDELKTEANVDIVQIVRDVMQPFGEQPCSLSELATTAATRGASIEATGKALQPAAVPTNGARVPAPTPGIQPTPAKPNSQPNPVPGNSQVPPGQPAPTPPGSSQQPPGQTPPPVSTVPGTLTTPGTPRAEAMTLVTDALAQLSHWQFQFRFERVVHEALTLSPGNATLAEIKTALEALISDGTVLGLDKREGMLTTAALVEKEQQFIASATGLQGRRFGVKPTEMNQLSGEMQSLLQSREGIVVATVSDDTRQSVVTTLLNTLEASGKTPKILVANAIDQVTVASDSARTSRHWLGRMVNAFKPERCQTIGAYLYQERQQLGGPFRAMRHGKQCLLVDSTERTSLDEMQALLSVAAGNGATVVMLHNPDGAQTSGTDTLSLLAKAGITPQAIGQAINPPSVTATLQRQGEPLGLRPGETVRILTDRKKQIAPLTARARQEAIDAGMLGQREITVTGLQPIFVPATEPPPFAAGQHLTVFGKSGGHYVIEALGSTKLTLRDKRTQKTLHVSPTLLAKQNVALYQPTALALRQGDNLIATGGDRALGLVKGQTYTVGQCDKDALVLTGAKRTLRIAPRHFTHLTLQYDYVRTIAQRGKAPVDRVILDANAYSVNANLIRSLGHLSGGNVTVHTQGIVLAERRLQHVSRKATAIDVVIDRAGQLSPKRHVLSLAGRIDMARDIIATHQGRSIDAKAVDFAIEKLAERQAGFTVADVVKVALDVGIGHSTKGSIDAVLDERKQTGTLIEGHIQGRQEKYFTTPEALAHEEGLVATLNAGIGTVAPLMAVQDVAGVTPTHLTGSQQKALKMVLTSHDRFVAIQGFAGSGKSTLWASIQEVARTLPDATTILGLAPTHQGVQALRDNGLTAQTLQSFLVEQAKTPSDLSGMLIVLDEASQVSNANMAAFTEHTKAQGGRSVVQGDTLQYQAIESGKPWDVALSQSDIAISYNNEIVRQKTEGMQTLVKATIKNDLTTAFSTLKTMSPQCVPRTSAHLSEQLNTSFIDVNTLARSPEYRALLVPHAKGGFEYKSQNAAIIQCAVDDYLSRTAAARENTYFVVATRDDMYESNYVAREMFKAKGMLPTRGQTRTHLENRDLEKVELTRALNYEKGQYVVLDNAYYKVLESDTQTGIVSLHDIVAQTGRQFMPAHHAQPVELYQVRPREDSQLCVGDRLRLTKTFKDRGVFANSRWNVTGVDKDGVDLTSLDGSKTHRLVRDVMEDAHWDHDYTITGFSAQSANAVYGIGLDLAWHRLSETPRKWLVEVTRPSQHITVYTTDEAKLGKQLATPVSKVAGIEVQSGEPLQVAIAAPVMPFAPTPPASPAPVTPAPGNQVPPASGKPPPSAPSTVAAVSPWPRPAVWPKVNATGIAKGLARVASEVTRHICGEPSTVQGDVYTYEKGLTVFVTGDKAGQWTNRVTGQQGDLVGLLAEQLGKTKEDSLQYAVAFLQGKSAETGVQTPTVNAHATTAIAGKHSPAPATKTNAPPIVPTPQAVTDFCAAKVATAASGQPTIPKAPALDAKIIKAGLRARAGEVTLQLLGKPNRGGSTPDNYRYEKNDRLSIWVGGDKAGQWTNFKTGEHGDLFDLMMQTLGVSFKDALRYADNLLGGTGCVTRTVTPAPQVPGKPKQYKDTPYTASRRRYAKTLYEGSVPIKGTESEQYLQRRGITVSPGYAIRHHHRVSTGMKSAQGKTLYAPAMLVVAKSADKAHLNLQAIFLQRGTGEKVVFPKRPDGSQPPSKKGIGPYRNEKNADFNHVEISPKKEGQTLSILTEGAEDALTLKQALKSTHIVATLSKGNFQNVDPKRLNAIVINALDNDGISIDKVLQDDHGIKTAVEKQLAAGKQVYLSMPNGAKDSNALLQTKGLDAVRDAITTLYRVEADSASAKVDITAIALPKDDPLHQWQKAFANKASNSDATSTKGYDEYAKMMAQSLNHNLQRINEQQLREQTAAQPAPSQPSRLETEVEKEI